MMFQLVSGLRQDFSYTMGQGRLSFAHITKKKQKNIPDVFGRFVLNDAKRNHVVA